MFPTSNQASGLRISLYVASGDFSEERCTQLAEWIEHLALSDWKSWVLDFSAVAHVNYRGLARLSRTARALEHTGGFFRWCGMSPYLRDIAAVAGACDRPVYRNRLEAVRGFEGTLNGV